MSRTTTLIILLVACSTGCSFQHHKRPSITAYPAVRTIGECEMPGIPFYLPKPLLVISKNFHHIEEAKVGATGPVPIPDSFDKQETYGQAALNSTVSLPRPQNPNPAGAEEKADGAESPADGGTRFAKGVLPASQVPSDGLAPHTFFTYEIVFVPDLTQKYVLQVEGGAGEIRAAMNLVNGWQFTGLGPYYMKDSSTAQNVFARGVALNLGLTGGADVVNSLANLSQAAAGRGGKMNAAEIMAIGEAMNIAATQETVDWRFVDSGTWEEEMVPIQILAIDDAGNALLDSAGRPQWVTQYRQTGRKIRHRLERYAEIHVYEPHLEGDRMVWTPLAEHAFNREYLGLANKTAPVGGATGAAEALGNILSQQTADTQANSQSGLLDVHRVPPASADPALVREVVTATMAQPAPEQRKGLFHFLRHRNSVENREVAAPLLAPAN